MATRGQTAATKRRANLYEPADLLCPSASLWDRLVHRIAAIGGLDSVREPPSRSLPEPKWDEVTPDISCQLLAIDRERDRVSTLVRVAPRAEYPAHRHAGIEELFLLYGDLWIGDRKLHAGDYNRAEEGRVHQGVWSERGCTCLLITSLQDAIFDV